jgi:hypothetical protein
VKAESSTEEMIFRYLHRRRMLKTFGRFIPAAKIEELFARTSEWQALKSFLPPRWFHTEDEIASGFLELRRLALRSLDETKHKTLQS